MSSTESSFLKRSRRAKEDIKPLIDSVPWVALSRQYRNNPASALTLMAFGWNAKLAYQICSASSSRYLIHQAQYGSRHHGV